MALNKIGRALAAAWPISTGWGMMSFGRPNFAEDLPLPCRRRDGGGPGDGTRPDPGIGQAIATPRLPERGDYGWSYPL